jgi:hypothetical protein
MMSDAEPDEQGMIEGEIREVAFRLATAMGRTEAWVRLLQAVLTWANGVLLAAGIRIRFERFIPESEED